MFLKSIKYKNTEINFTSDISVIKMSSKEDREGIIKAIIEGPASVSFEYQGDVFKSSKYDPGYIFVIDNKEIMKALPQKGVSEAILSLVNEADSILTKVKNKMSVQADRIIFFSSVLLLIIMGVAGSPFSPLFILSPVAALFLLVLGIMFPFLTVKKVIKKEKRKLFNLFKEILLEAKTKVLNIIKPILEKDLEKISKPTDAVLLYVAARLLYVKLLNGNKKSLILFDDLFTGLDKNKIIRLNSLLEDLTEDFQFIIFT